ncbi:Vacuolar protein 8 [Coemansia sp. RSA 2336]|nr:Vacuolar protein 8 [Coemansia sp. RSA 2336]
MGGVISCCATADAEYQPLLADQERQAVAALVKLFETDTRISFYDGPALQALTVLAHSDVHHLQLSAATAFSEISEYDVRAVGREALEPIVYLLQAAHADVQQAAAAALGNLAGDAANRRLIVELGAVQHLVRQMLAPGADAQINAVGCITNLAGDDENKLRIARSGALPPLVRLARSRDMRVQRNAAGALLNMTHRAEVRQLLVNAGAVAALAELVQARDDDTLYYAATALSNIAVDSEGRNAMCSLHVLVPQLLAALETRCPRVQAQVALTLRNMASDTHFQLRIVEEGALDILLPLLHSPHGPLAASAAACLRNLSIHAANETPIVVAGLVPELLDLAVDAADADVRCHAIATVRNLAANSGDKQALLDADLLDRLGAALDTKCPQARAELAAAFSVFVLNDQLWRPVVERGLCVPLARLLLCGHADAELSACLALGALAGRHAEAVEELLRLWPRGLRNGLTRQLAESASDAARAAALWLISALLAGRPSQARRLLAADTSLLATVDACAVIREPSKPWALLPTIFAGHGAESADDDSTTVASTHEAQRVQSLARQILDQIRGS